MRLREHIILSSLAGGTGYFVSGSPMLALSIILSGIFIDLDHFVDYFSNFAVRFDVKDFFQRCHGYEFRKFYVPLHSYEFIILLAVIYCFYPADIVLGILVGSFIHIFADLFHNSVYFCTYSFIYRLLNKFNNEKLFKPPYGKDKGF